MWRQNYPYSILYWKQKNWCLTSWKQGCIEIDGYGHEGRNLRQLMIEGHGIIVIETNPEA